MAFGILRRRRFLQLVGATGAATATPWLPGCNDSSGSGARAEARFFAPGDRRLIEELAGVLIPEDHTVGAIGAGAVEYIDRFLAVFDNPVPTLFRGGPSSGREPYPDPRTGAPSDEYPANSFLDILPPSRMQQLAFRILLDGSESVTNGTLNAPAVPIEKGLRRVFREGIAGLRAAAPDGIAGLDEDAAIAVFRGTAPEFQKALLSLLAEGMFCAPEYGGNRDGVGWRDYSYDGDSQPLGHTLFSRETQTLYDRQDQPNQTIDSNRPNDGLEPPVEALITTLVAGLGGKRFF